MQPNFDYTPFMTGLDMVEIINISDARVKFHVNMGPGQDRHYDLAPGAVTAIQRGYTESQDLGNGNIRPSFLQRRTGIYDANGRSAGPARVVRLDSEEAQRYLENVRREEAAKVAPPPPKTPNPEAAKVELSEPDLADDSSVESDPETELAADPFTVAAVEDRIEADSEDSSETKRKRKGRRR